MKNWRPVTLCNVDYKIVCKALGALLSSVIATVTQPEQSYCVPGRCIYDNIAVAKYLFAHHEKTDTPMAMISLDQQKAFDSVSHEYLLAVLDAFGFPPRWIEIIRGLYRNSAILIKHQGKLLPAILFLQGIRQGCPLSGMLYDFSLEPLLIMLRRRLQQFAVHLPSTNMRPLMLAYADDLSIFVTDDAAFSVATAVFAQYERCSGAKINLAKSQGLWCGRWKNRMDSPLGIQWTNSCLKYLGVYIGREGKSRNSQMVLEKLSGALNSWRTRLHSLSLKGKVVVINYLITSSIVHALKAEAFEEGFIRLLQTKVLDTFWSGRRWVAERTLCLPVREGGLGLTDLVVKTKCLQVRAFQRVFCRRDTLFSRLWVDALGGRGQGEQYYLLSVRPPFPRHWSQDITCTVQTWGRVRPEFRLQWNSIGYTQFAKIPVNFNPDLTDSMLANARGFDCGLGPHATIGDILDANGCCRVPINSQALRAVVASARGKLRQLRGGDSTAELEDAFVLERAPHTSFGALTTRLVQDVFARTTRGMGLVGLRRWNPHFGVDMGASGGISSRVVYSYPSNRKDSDVAFQLLHHSLVHPNQLSHIDRSVRRECTVCAGEGTLFHRFFTCTALRELMNLVVRLCGLVHPSFGISHTSFLLGPRSCSQVNCLISFILTLAKSTIHLYYMRAGIQEQNTDNRQHTVALRRHFVARLKKRIRLEYLATDEEAFNCTWNQIATVQDGVLVLRWELQTAVL